ncbi:MAG TPA: arginine deiminase family protein [Longimicrobiales bacterium]
MIAITRAVPDNFDRCELTHLARVPIDIARARREHEAYESALRSAGCTIVRLPALRDQADSVFVEDAAVVVAELAVVTRPGAASRRAETASMHALLQEYMSVAAIVAPGTLDGGDVLRIGRRIFVGISTRTNESGATQLASLLEPFGYTVTRVPVARSLHLKSAVTAASDELIVLDPAVVPAGIFGVPCVLVPPEEAMGANVLAVDGVVLCPASAPQTARRLEQHGLVVRAVDTTELAKAEAGLTCCSVLLPGT